jgi:hypothetical protein
MGLSLGGDESTSADRTDSGKKFARIFCDVLLLSICMLPLVGAEK